MRIGEIIGAPLNEKRRNPEKNKKTTTLAELQKYAGQKDVFVSFTTDVGSASHFPGTSGHDSRHQAGLRSRGETHNTSGSKLGVNPRSKYDTPIGIYAYPVDYVLDRKGDVEFASQMPYLQVFRAQGHFLDLNNYGEADLERDLQKLKEIRRGHGVAISDALRSADPDTPAGKIWNATRLVADSVTSDLNNAAQDDYYDEDNPEPDPADFDDDEDYWAARDEWENERADSARENAKDIAKTSVQWSKILRELGYEGATDIGGSGVIHENEPTQAVFFSIKPVKPLEVIHNAYRTERTPSQEDIWIAKPKILINMMRQGKVSAEQVANAFKQNPYALKKDIRWTDLTPEVQQYMLTHWREFLSPHNNEFLSFAPLPTNTLIQAIEADPWRATAIRKWNSKLLAYVLSNRDKFRSVLPALKLPPKVMANIVRENPEIIDQLPGSPVQVDDAILNAVLDVAPEKFVRWWQSYERKMIKPATTARFYKWILKSEYKNQWEMFLQSMITNFGLQGNVRNQFIASLRVLPKNKAVAYAKQFIYDANDRNARGYQIWRVIAKARPDVVEALVPRQTAP